MNALNQVRTMDDVASQGINMQAAKGAYAKLEGAYREIMNQELGENVSMTGVPQLTVHAINHAATHAGVIVLWNSYLLQEVMNMNKPLSIAAKRYSYSLTDSLPSTTI